MSYAGQIGIALSILVGMFIAYFGGAWAEYRQRCRRRDRKLKRVAQRRINQGKVIRLPGYEQELVERTYQLQRQQPRPKGRDRR
jgi:hypothetical protein